MSQAPGMLRQEHADLVNEIVLYSGNFASYSPVNIFQWIFNNVYNAVTLGKLSDRDGGYDWLIAKIVGVVDMVMLSPVLLHTINTAKRRSSGTKLLDSHHNLLTKEYILTPNAAISFAFPIIKFVCCLDISRSSFAIMDNGLLPIRILVETLLQTVKDIHRNIAEDALFGLNKIFLAIIGHKPETDETYVVWSGELLLYSNMETILADIQHRIDSVIDEAFKSIASNKSAENKKNTINSFIKAIGYHMNLLPSDACPKSILFSSGGTSVALDSSLSLLAKMNYSLNIIVETVSSESNILFYPDISGLEALACSSVGGGAVVVINKNDISCISKVVNSLVTQGLFYWHVGCTSSGTNSSYSVNPRQFVLRNTNRANVDEHVVAAYEVDSTLEHMVSCRINEGYQLVDIVYKLDEVTPILTVKMEKILTKLSLLRYQISASISGKRDSGKGSRDTGFLFPHTLQLARSDMNELQGIGRKYPWKFAKSILGLRWLYGKLKVELVTLREKALLISAKATQSHDLLVAGVVQSIRDSDVKVGQVIAKYFCLLHSPLSFGSDSSKHIAAGMGKVGCKYFATCLDTVEVLTSFDDTLVLHFLLPNPTYAQVDSFVPHLHEHIFNEISKQLQLMHVEITVINPNKYLVLLEEGHEKKSNLYGMKKAASPSSQQECALLLVDYVFASNVFLTVKIRKLVSSIGQLNSLVFKLGLLVHDCIKQVSCVPFLLPHDLSLYSLAPTSSNSKNARNCVQGARAKAAVKNYSIGADEHQYLEYLFEEILTTKINVGFRAAHIVKSNSTYKAVLIGVSKWNPSGSSYPSLVQCKVDISPDGISVEYYWLKHTYDKYLPASPAASFSVSHDLDSSTHCERSTSHIESFVSMLIAQDKQIFQFYELIDMFRFHCDSNAGLRYTASSVEFCVTDASIYPPLSAANWDLLLKHEVHQEEVGLPCFSASSQGVVPNRVLLQVLIESLSTSIPSSCLFQLTEASSVIHIQAVDNLLIIVRFNDEDCVRREVDDAATEEMQCDLFKAALHVIQVPTKRFSASVELGIEAMSTLIGVAFNNPVLSSSIECISKILLGIRQLLYKLVFNSLTRVLYHYTLLTLQADPLNTNGAKLNSADVEMSIQFMHRHRIESDISVLCRRKSALLTKATACNIQSTLTSFQDTLGRLILGSEAFDIFVMDSKTASAATIAPFDSISFIRLFLVCKVHDDNNSAVTAQLSSFDRSRSTAVNTFEFLVPSSPAKLCERMHRLCLLLGANCEAVDISLLLEYISVKGSDRSRGNSNLSTTSDSVSSDGSLELVQASLKQFVAMDYLSTMITSLHTPFMSNTLTADNLLLVHQCIQETARSKKFSTNLVFVNVPSILKKSGASAGGSMATTSLARLPMTSGVTYSSLNYDIISESFEGELRSQLGRLGISKLGDILYTKSWFTEQADSARASPLLPCWVLITLTSNAHLDSMIASTITVSTSVMAFSESEENHVLNDRIAVKVTAILENCCFRTNQRHLLRDIYETRLMTPLVLSLEQQPAANPASNPALLPAPGGESESSGHAATPTTPSLATEKVPLIPPRASSEVSTKSSTPTPSAVQLLTGKEPVYKAVMNIAPRVKRNPNAVTAPDSTPALRAPNPYNELFSNRQFVCLRQDEIVFPFFASSLLSCESAIRHLETSALNQLTLTNYEHFFVCQDANAAVYYMAFDGAGTSTAHGCIKLGIYGLFPMDKKMKEELTNILEHRLIEITAKTISAALARNTPVSLPYLSFLKQSAISRSAHYQVRVWIPPYVSDLFLLCTIARQVMLSQVFNKLNLHASTHVEEKKERKISASTAPVAVDGSVGKTGNDGASGVESRRVLHHSEIIHPALRGYTLSSSASHSLHSNKLQQRKLTRTRQVDHEFHTDSTVVNPIFFGKRNIQRLPVPLSTKYHTSFEEIPVIWHQNDFTFLYNWLGPLSAGSQHRHSTGTKLIGQGLAIVELVPQLGVDQGRLLFTGSHESLQKDINELMPCALSDSSSTRHLNAKITVLTATEGGTDSLGQRSSTPNESLNGTLLDVSTHSVDEDKNHMRNYIDLLVYPAASMHTQALVDYLIACVDQAIAVYCLERVFAATSVIKDVTAATDVAAEEPTRFHGQENDVLHVFHRYLNGSMSDPAIFHSFFFPTDWKYTDYLRFVHNIVSKFKFVNIGNNCVGVDRIAFKLPYKDALELHSKLVKHVQESAPALNTNVIVSECDPVFATSSLSTGSNQLKWLDLKASRKKQQMLITSTLFGEGIFSHLQQDSRDSSQAVDCKLFSDSDVIAVGISSGISSCKSKRGYFLEFVVSPSGLNIFYCNISTPIVNSVYEYALTAANQIQEKRIGLQQQHLQALGLIPQIPSTDLAAGTTVVSAESVDELSDREKLYQQLIDRLIWANRTLAKYSVKAPNDVVDDVLTSVPISAWGVGSTLQSSLTFPLPSCQVVDHESNQVSFDNNNSIEAFAAYRHAIAARAKGSYDLVRNPLDYRSFLLVFPIPRTKCVHVTEVKYNGNEAVLDHRVLHVATLLSSLGFINDNSLEVMASLQSNQAVEQVLTVTHLLTHSPNHPLTHSLSGSAACY
jgi:hypothetical protein